MYPYIMARRGKRTRPRTAPDVKARRGTTPGMNQNAAGTQNSRITGVSAAKARQGTTPGRNQNAAGTQNSKVRKVPNWAKFVIGAFVTAIIGTLIANLYPYVNNKIFPSQPIIFRVTSENEPDGVGWRVTVPDQERLQPLLNSIHSCDSLRTAALAAGGVRDNDVSMNLLVQGNTSSGVTITGMHVRIIKRMAPLNGAYVYCNGAGEEEAMPINFNLDDQVPDAMGALSGTASEPSFFANGSVVHLDNNEVYPFQIHATDSNSAVQWVIEVSIVINGHPSTVTIDDNGMPFHTSAALPMSQYEDYLKLPCCRPVTCGDASRIVDF